MPCINMIYCKSGFFHMPGGLFGFPGIGFYKQNPHIDHPVDILTTSTYRCAECIKQPKVVYILPFFHKNNKYNDIYFINELLMRYPIPPAP